LYTKNFLADSKTKETSILLLWNFHTLIVIPIAPASAVYVSQLSYVTFYLAICTCIHFYRVTIFCVRYDSHVKTIFLWTCFFMLFRR